MTNNEPLDGIIDLHFRLVNKNDEILADPRYLNIAEASNSHQFLLVDETEILLPLTDDFDLATLESAINAWIARPSLVTRGVAFSAREVIKKLKKLGFREKSTEGSHVHFVSEVRKGKVTVPVHGGELRKGTLKSILNQAGIDMAVFAMA